MDRKVLGRQEAVLGPKEDGAAAFVEERGFGGSMQEEAKEEWNDEETTAASSSKQIRIVILGMPLHRCAKKPESQLLALAVTVISAAVLFATVQERVLYVPGFRYTGWMSTLTSLTYVCCALLERVHSTEPRRLGPWIEYAKLSVLTTGGMYLTNWSLKYLSYPLRVVVKSSKLVPTMALSVIYLKKRYAPSQYISVLLLTLGVVLFTLGDAKGKALFDSRGLVLISIGSLAESLAANFEEKRLFNQLGCSANEVLLYSSLFGVAWAGGLDAVQGETLPAIKFSVDHPEAVLLICLAAVAGYVAMVGILLLVRHFGATLAEIVKSCRKILTICISFCLFGKPWTSFHVVGGLLFASSIAVERFTAGGTSRRYAGILMSTSLLVALGLLSSSHGTSTYRILIDVGTTATRLHIFRFDAWTAELRPIDGEAYVYVAREPGFGEDTNVTGLTGIVQDFLGKAKVVVPEADWHSTRTAVRANSALRYLPEQRGERLLEIARQELGKSGFQDAGTSFLSGPEEASASWLSVNFLLGSVHPGVEAVQNPFAVFDMRSMSLQAAQYVRDHTAQKLKRTSKSGFIERLALPYGSGFANIYRYSYLHFGLIAARKAAAAEVDSVGGVDGGTWSRCLSRSPDESEAEDPGSSCADLARRILQVGGKGKYTGPGKVDDKAACSLPDDLPEKDRGFCTFGGGWSPHLVDADGHAPVEGSSGSGSTIGNDFRDRQGIVLMSHFFSRMAAIGKIDPGAQQVRLTAKDFSEAAREACAAGRHREGARSQGQGWQRQPQPQSQAEPSHRKEGLASNEMLCFDLSYLAVLLSEGLGLLPSRELLVINKIQHGGLEFEASWALGYVLRTT